MPHMTLTPFEWSFVGVLVVFTWYLLRRDFDSRDALAATVQGLSGEVAKLRTLMAENYVTKHDHRLDLDRVREDIAEHAERFQRELENHRDACPGRR